MDQVVIPQGTMVIVGVRGSKVNKSVWGEDAEDWNPDRWLSSMPQTIKDARIPGVYSNM